MRAQAERETESRATTERDAQARAQQSAQRAKAEADWIRSIQAKVRGNVIVPPEMSGNPEAIFEVVQLPTGEIIDVQLRKSSGVRAYDDAVQRAILKSSPLPRPERADLFQRALTLKLWKRSRLFGRRSGTLKLMRRASAPAFRTPKSTWPC